MSALDWTLFVAYLAGMLVLGARASRGARTGAGFFVADRAMPWWAVGLSVMATQASAITFIGTTGQGFDDGLRFVQFYFGLPLAMLILCVTLVPLYHRARVFTAYEWLGQRFDDRVRRATAVLFLLSRGLALGVVIYAPSVVLSLLLGWSLPVTVLTMTVVAVAYTMAGGIRAVIWTDVTQMVLIVVGLGAAFLVMLGTLPDGLSLGDALPLAEATGHLAVLDLSLDPSDRFTVWSGLLGGTFLFLAYFGCDQSQVQRLLTSRSLSHTRRALLLNAVLKLPLQFGVLFLGVTLFLAWHFAPPPLVFDPGMAARLEAVAPDAWAALDAEHTAAQERRRDAGLRFLEARRQLDGPAGGSADDPAGGPARRDAWSAQVEYVARDAEVQRLRGAAAGWARTAVDPDFDDTNHVFPWFVIHALPAGLVGLLIAAVFAAAMSSIDSELNALATASVVDVFGRRRRRGTPPSPDDAPRDHDAPGADEPGLVRRSRGFTLAWGALAATFALYAGALGSVIEAVNRVGSWFYGSLLGVFVLALAFPRSDGRGAFWGLLAGMAAVAAATQLDLAWLWLNPLGCLTVVVVGLGLSRRGTATGRSAGTA